MTAAATVMLVDLVTVLIVLFAVAAVFKLIDSLNGYGDPQPYTPTRDDLAIMTYPNEEDLDVETKRLKNLDDAVAGAKSAYALRLWTNKRAEFLRNQRWKNLTEIVSGSERISNTLTT